MKKFLTTLISIALIATLFISCFDSMPVAPTEAEKGYINSAIVVVAASEIYFFLQSGVVPGMSITIEDTDQRISWNDFDMNLVSGLYGFGETMVSGIHDSDSSVSENNYNITIDDAVYPGDRISIIMYRNATEITYLKLNDKVLDPSGWNPES